MGLRIKTSKEAAEDLTNQGYRRVSNRYRIVARVDEPDWEGLMALNHSPWDIEEGKSWVRCLGEGAADWYRRVLSKDKIEGLPLDVFRKIPGSGHDPCGYIAPKEDD